MNTLKMNRKPLCGHKVGDPLPACIAGYCMGATAWGLSDAATDYSFIFAGLRAQKFCCLLPAAIMHMPLCKASCGVEGPVKKLTETCHPLVAHVATLLRISTGPFRQYGCR